MDSSTPGFPVLHHLQSLLRFVSIDCDAAAAAKSRHLCPTLCDSGGMAAHQAPPSLGFSRQEHWSGLPFPSPMHEKWKWSHWVVSNSQQPHGLQTTRLLHPWDFLGKSTGVGCHCLLQSPLLERFLTVQDNKWEVPSEWPRDPSDASQSPTVAGDVRTLNDTFF